MARILITDDDSRSRQMLAFFLQLNGHETDEAADGRQAVERFLAHSFDVVLINADMPAMAGWEACERLRQKSQVPIVIVAADGHPSVRGRAWTSAWTLSLHGDERAQQCGALVGWAYVMNPVCR
jgi:CheY-like chemotaxis protein